MQILSQQVRGRVWTLQNPGSSLQVPMLLLHRPHIGQEGSRLTVTVQVRATSCPEEEEA